MWKNLPEGSTGSSKRKMKARQRCANGLTRSTWSADHRPQG